MFCKRSTKVNKGCCCCQGDRGVDRAHMIRGRPLQSNSEPQSEVIAGATLATSLSEREPAVLRARLAASRY